ncbi:leucine-rich repeat-containing protein 9-like isoform X2 [Denticeps clupeoides]|uniref:leucine-rich repeat-containing protein 9-like isoform X2 n=1 Tax=Denticeps clupeoides TaxID=299321 RepID=UPI0010A2F6C9|nr:leucine-rich repeat-containing protein 9-like isoform X2 [Denticeps clupeoides]
MTDEEIVKELCSINGISYDKVCQDGSGVTSLEVFFSGFPRMVGLSLFPRLSKLVIVAQSVSCIKGLEHCPLLRELWAVECHLTEISGVGGCLQLQKLYLYDNHIVEISNLHALLQLQVLWLNSNRITEMKGLSSLGDLQELNLADNSIVTIGDSLDQNANLQRLNLSGNKISSFKELTYLSRLDQLRELSLSDTQSSPNPICLLCNYSTHILYHLPHLLRLDGYTVSSKQVKDAAESTVQKKMMYYSMRMRSIQRQLREAQLQLLEKKKTRLQLPADRIRTLSYTHKSLELDLSELQSGGRSSEHLAEQCSAQSGAFADLSNTPQLKRNPEQRILGKMAALKERLKRWNFRMEELEHQYQLDLKLLTARKELMVHFLLTELETVGNVRFEEGSPSAPWFTSCHELLLSRFCACDYTRHGVTGLKVHRIIRIQNRALRSRFEDRLHSLLASSDSPFVSQSYKRSLEYLFYVPDPGHAPDKNEILDIPEYGLKSADLYMMQGRERAVPLSSSLSVAERFRIQFEESGWSGQNLGRGPVPFKHGQLIICKVFLGKSVAVRDDVPINPAHFPKVHSVYRSANTGPAPSSHDECGCSQKQTEWFVFDHELVLPEYFIDFEYITEDQDQLSLLIRSNPHPTPTLDDHMTINILAQDEAVMGMEPALKPRTKMLSLSDKTLLNVAKANILSQITVLNLHGNSLSSLKEISCLTGLRSLTISFNEFTHLDDISYLSNLESVDASFNHVTSLGGVRALPRLQQLDLCCNLLTHPQDEAAILQEQAPALLRLDTRYNPWDKSDSVRMVLLGCLRSLTHLDDVLVSEEEAVAAAALRTTGSRISQACLLDHSRTDCNRPRSLSLLSTAHLMSQVRPSPWELHDLPPDWTSKITALSLDSQGLSCLSGLDRLVNLRWASFNHNKLSCLEGLQCCLKLEELSLDRNRLTSLHGLDQLPCLTRLSVNENQIGSLDGSVLDRLPNLHFLSAEKNSIDRLYGVQRARSLLKLYVGNNAIATSRDIYHLKALTNLIILDLYGNPLVERQVNYRMYVVFHLPSLRALDGVTVETSERENARDMFGGRLTPDMVSEKLGHSNFTEISKLELSSCSIRMVDLSPADLFLNLHSINLEHNNLTSFCGLICLPKLKILCLNYNHVESILPREKGSVQLSSRQMLYNRVPSSGYGQQNSSKTIRDSVPGDCLDPIMPSLEVLYLGYNGISNLSELQLSRLTNLRALFLQGNEIKSVEGLNGLCSLRELVLDRNRIRTLGENSFCTLSSLLELHLVENRIRELNNLQPLIQLHRLFLGMNKIQDVSEVEKLDLLPSLTELSVVGNPVVRRPLYRPTVVLHLTQLRVLDGLMITLEERTRAELLNTETQANTSAEEHYHRATAAFG